jgi:hypothetical protein
MSTALRTERHHNRSTRAAQHDPSTDPRHTPSAQNDGVWTAPAAPIGLPAAKATAPVPLTSAIPPTPGSTHQYVNPLVEPSCATGRAYTGPTIEGDGSRTASPPIAATAQGCVSDHRGAPGSRLHATDRDNSTARTDDRHRLAYGEKVSTPMDEAARDVRLHAGDCARAIARGRLRAGDLSLRDGPQSKHPGPRVIAPLPPDPPTIGLDSRDGGEQRACQWPGDE